MGTEKIVNIENLAQVLDTEKAEGKKIVFTNGCFDILHKGHIRYLTAAKNLGDKLVVGVNSDTSVNSIKGAKRPIMNLTERTEVLAALEMIDWIIPFDELTPIKIINNIKPDIHVKGGDYRAEDLPEAETVRSYGGQIIIIPLESGYSTSSLIEKICSRYGRKLEP